MDSHSFPIDPANAEQAGDWDGGEGEQWATFSREYERLLGVFDAPLLEAAQIQPGDRCLDVGCGTGATTRALATTAAPGSALGLDVSGPMLTVARGAAKQAGIRNLSFEQGDVQLYPFNDSSFDVAVSRMGCMFFADPAAAFANIGRALKPGGRLALMVWRTIAENVWIMSIDAALGEEASEDDDESRSAAYAPGPFSLGDRALSSALLEGAGFIDITATPLDIPLAFGTMEQAKGLVDSWIDASLGHEERAARTAALQRLLEENATGEGVFLPSATWLITARRPSS